MAVLMANASEVSSTENVQYLYNKNVELETKRRKSAQARIPTDPNVWQQMRENFETIILVDHAFAEQHEIELALWQMHYRQIEEIRANFNAAMAVVGSPPRNGGKAGSARPDRAAKIRSQMKTFLSETTGFYHELMLKIKAKYGLPLGYFSDDTENEAFLSKESNISAELKKGLISCHRSLIYLGDLARYKGIYGEEESKLRDFAAASGYYMQASSFWPSSGNPHHQLAILASYSGDEFVAVYRYFRSLAVENPFSMARDNLIIAFEKNRLNFSQLIGGAKAPAAKPVPVRMNGKGRPRAEARFSGKDHKIVVKERAASTTSTIKTFSIKFVRLHGILFSRTSLETFIDVLSMGKHDFMDLLSSQDIRSFGSDAAESELFIVRLVAILIFSVHNADAGRDPEDQLRAVLLEYAYAAAYEFMGIITERCLKLQDPLSSFLFPGFLVFVEWLACRAEAPRDFGEEKLANNRAFFWNNCVSIFNKVVPSGLVVEATNHLSLREDFELRGFLPLQSAQQILDFSRKPSQEKRARGQKLLVAARALSTSFVRVGEQFVYFDPKLNKFVIGAEKSETPQKNLFVKDIIPAENKMGLKPSEPLFVDGEDEEEEIVFKALTPENVLRRVADTPSMNLNNGVAPIQLNSSNWQLKKEAFVTNGFKNLSMMENGYGGMQPVIKPVMAPSKSQSNMSFAYALNGLSITPALLLPVGAKRSPVSRPLRHAGPPPGFTPEKDDDICIVDDYSWLDGYQVPSPEFNNPCNLSRHDETKMVSFPFPGKQFQVPLENPKDYHFSQPLMLFQEQMRNGSQPQQKQFQGQSLWNGQFLV